MLTILPRRTIRRLLIFLFLLAFAVTFTEHLRDTVRSHSGLTVLVREPPATVTQVRTVWMEMARTAMPEARETYDDPEQAQNHFSSPAPLQKHTYRPDGLLEVNPEGPHPIFELIRNAEANWNAKLRRSSKTLAEAVVEYENRYRRSPPLGFDDWWSYVQKHNVQLPDEYDQIYEDLEPYWGMNPKDLQDIVAEWELHDDSFTLGKIFDGPITLVNYSLPGNDKAEFNLAQGAYEIMDTLEEVEEHIPPFRAVFSPHDNPNLPTDHELREIAITNAARGTFIDVNNPPPVKLDGWLSSCDPASPAWHTPIDWEKRAPPQQNKTFIYNHRKAMNPCLHPSLLLLHGQFLSHNKGPVPHRRMIPQFSYSPTLLHHDIMLAMPINWVKDLPPEDNPDWEKKYDERLQWRGTNTGIWHARDTRWRDAHRARLAEWATLGLADNMTVLLSKMDDKSKVGAPVEVKKSRYTPAMLDVALSAPPGGCAPDMCEELKNIFEFRKSQNLQLAGKYKYIIDVDGNGWSSRFKRLVTSNSLIFKSTIYPEWFGDRIAPWVHYIPVQIDLSDVYDALLFFRGDLNGDNAHDDLARKIALAGRQWSLQFWRKEDLTAYNFRLFLEYSRVMSPDRLTMNYVYPEP